MMGEMVAGIAHEINQPLYAISNFAAASAQLLSANNSQHADRLRTLNLQIAEQAVRAGDIIRRLRAFARKTDGEHAAFDLNDAVHSACQLLAPEALRKNITVRIEAAEDPPLRMFGDRIQIEQILVNLVRNAFEAIQDSDHHRRVTVRTWLLESEARVTVQDTGAGIPEHSLARIFDPFFTTKRQGLGMGLAISRTIVEAHGGRIWASPNHSVGTIFTVALPHYQEE
jgi:two-component system sensor kinase FixL